MMIMIITNPQRSQRTKNDPTKIIATHQHHQHHHRDDDNGDDDDNDDNDDNDDQRRQTLSEVPVATQRKSSTPIENQRPNENHRHP